MKAQLGLCTQGSRTAGASREFIRDAQDAMAWPYKTAAAPSAEDLDLMAAEERLRELTAAEMDDKAFGRFWRWFLVGLICFWTGIGWLVLWAIRRVLR